jgi:signal transduction histidine kinase
VLGEHAPELARAIAELDARIDLGHTIAGLEHSVSRLNDGLDRIRQIVLDLREFARLDEAIDAAVDINQGIALTVRLVRGQAKKKDVDVVVDCAALPPVVCHGAKINQVVLNLLVNAIDACQAGGRVEVQTRPTENGIAIVVSDTGPGIDPDIRDKIFDPFFTTKDVGKGMGLGLAISHSIVQAHGGTIEFEARAGGGTRFHVRLPRARTKGEANGAAS